MAINGTPRSDIAAVTGEDEQTLRKRVRPLVQRLQRRTVAPATADRD
jgi:hypothetical protein